MANRQSPFYESALFWVALGGVAAVIGGIVLSIGVAQVIGSIPRPSLWSNVWFDLGLIAVVAAAGMGLWALVLFLAHRHASYHGVGLQGPSAEVSTVRDSPPRRAQDRASDWEVLEEERIRGYEQNRGLFLVHTWRPSTVPNQKVDVTARVAQHRDGPLTQGKIKSVEYVWGPKFAEHAQVVTRATDGYAVTVSLFGPLLLLARVSFTDREPPLLLTRYLNFEEDARESEADSPRSAAYRVEQLRSDFAAQRQAVREHLAELEQILGPGPAGGRERDDPKTEIGAVLLGRYFQDQPIKPNEFPGLIELLDLYRREPWTPDPPLNTIPLVERGPQGQQRWQMSLDPLKAYTVHADKAAETLEWIKQSLLQDLIPRMRHWEKWH